MTAALETTQPRGEDGRFASPTSQPDASATAAPVASDAATDAAGGEHAPVTPAKPVTSFDGKTDPYEAAVKSVNAKYADDPSAVVAADQNAKPADKAPTPPGQNTRDASQTPSPSPTVGNTDKTSQEFPTVDPVKDYGDTLSKNEHDLLKSIPGMLLPAAEWKALSQTERYEHIQDVRAIRSQRARQFNDSKQTVSEPEPQTQLRGARDTGVQQPQAQPGDVALPPEVEQALAEVATEYGPESSVYRAQRLIAQRTEREFQSQHQNRQQDAQKAANERQMRAIEDDVFTKNQAKYPTLADAQTRDKLRQDARDYFVIRHQQGRPLTPEQAIEFVTHNTLYPQILSAQQQQAQANRQRSLAGTFDAGAPAPTKPAAGKPRSEDEIYADAQQQINNREKQRELAAAG